MLWIKRRNCYLWDAVLSRTWALSRYNLSWDRNVCRRDFADRSSDMWEKAKRSDREIEK